MKKRSKTFKLGEVAGVKVTLKVDSKIAAWLLAKILR